MPRDLMRPGMLPEKARQWLNGILQTFGVNLSVAEATVNPASLNAGAASAIGTVAVEGAVLGDFVKASFSLDLQGVILSAWVSDADEVSYQFYNPTAGTIDLAEGALRVRVEQQ